MHEKNSSTPEFLSLARRWRLLKHRRRSNHRTKATRQMQLANRVARVTGDTGVDGLGLSTARMRAEQGVKAILQYHRGMNDGVLIH